MEVGLDLRAVVVPSGHLATPEQKAVTMLIDEVEQRTRVRWQCVDAWPPEGTPVITVGWNLSNFQEVQKRL